MSGGERNDRFAGMGGGGGGGGGGGIGADAALPSFVRKPAFVAVAMIVVLLVGYTLVFRSSSSSVNVAEADQKENKANRDSSTTRELRLCEKARTQLNEELQAVKSDKSALEERLDAKVRSLQDELEKLKKASEATTTTTTTTTTATTTAATAACTTAAVAANDCADDKALVVNLRNKLSSCEVRRQELQDAIQVEGRKLDDAAVQVAASLKEALPKAASDNLIGVERNLIRQGVELETVSKDLEHAEENVVNSVSKGSAVVAKMGDDASRPLDELSVKRKKRVDASNDAAKAIPELKDQVQAQGENDANVPRARKSKLLRNWRKTRILADQTSVKDVEAEKMLMREKRKAEKESPVVEASLTSSDVAAAAAPSSEAKAPAADAKAPAADASSEAKAPASSEAKAPAADASSEAKAPAAEAKAPAADAAAPSSEAKAPAAQGESPRSSASAAPGAE